MQLKTIFLARLRCAEAKVGISNTDESVATGIVAPHGGSAIGQAGQF